MFGLKPEDIEQDLEVWAVNRESFELFHAMTTQWRSGMNGATGFDYSAVPAVMDLLGIKGRKRRRRAFDDLRLMEREALATMREARE